MRMQGVGEEKNREEWVPSGIYEGVWPEKIKKGSFPGLLRIVKAHRAFALI